MTFAIAATVAVPESAAQSPSDAPPVDPTWVLASGRSIALFPSEDVYPLYVADPHRPTNVVAESVVVAGGVPSMSSPITRLGAGGRFGIVRFAPAKPEGRSWQVSIEAGLDAIFDSQNRLDVVGWDGNYGLTVTTASRGAVAVKMALLHVSAHVGDEYLERTARERFNYTREELSVGAALRLSPRWQVYGETAMAYRMGDEALEPWRLQWGVEHEGRPGPCGQRFGCYVAADFSSMQERDWRLDGAVELGFVARRAGRATRIFFAWHKGRPTVNAFYRESVSTLSVGLKSDF